MPCLNWDLNQQQLALYRFADRTIAQSNLICCSVLFHASVSLLIQNKVYQIQTRMNTPIDSNAFLFFFLSSSRSTPVDASSSAVDPVTFDHVEINEGNLFNAGNNIVTISRTGYYYVYISAATQAGQVKKRLSFICFSSNLLSCGELCRTPNCERHGHNLSYLQRN